MMMNAYFIWGWVWLVVGAATALLLVLSMIHWNYIKEEKGFSLAAKMCINFDWCIVGSWRFSTRSTLSYLFFFVVLPVMILYFFLGY